MTMEPAFASWESILTSAAYLFAHADGVNRFYVAAEHRDLIIAFEFPPNCFDGFILASEATAIERAMLADQRAILAEAEAGNAEAELAAIQRTRSWRITAPLRAAGRIAKRILGPILAARA